jgi:hypothetical protein
MTYIKNLTSVYRIKTEPLNWILQKQNRAGKWINATYHDDVSSILSQFIVNKSAIESEIESISKDLGLGRGADLSAYYLTKVLKHPVFRSLRGRPCSQKAK